MQKNLAGRQENQKLIYTWNRTQQQCNKSKTLYAEHKAARIGMNIPTRKTKQRNDKQQKRNLICRTQSRTDWNEYTYMKNKAKKQRK